MHFKQAKHNNNNLKVEKQYIYDKIQSIKIVDHQKIIANNY